MAKARKFRRAFEKREKAKPVGTDYIDIVGDAHEYRWLAMLSSFIYIVSGGFKYGFPVSSSRIKYGGWACYPFLFLSPKIREDEITKVVIHERIHILQQREILLTLGLPLLALAFFLEIGGCLSTLELILMLCTIPMLPTICYGLDMLRVWLKYKPVTFEDCRKHTSFELEAEYNSVNMYYLKNRPMFNNLRKYL